MNPEQEAKIDHLVHLLEAILALLDKKVNQADKGWLSIDEAGAWLGRSPKYIRQKLKERRLWCQRLPGRGGGELRIPKAHLDEQMALGFPVLQIPPRALERLDAERAAAKLLREARPLKDIIPGPERDESKQPPQRVY